MVREIVWSPRSLEDLKSIHEFVANDSLRYATHLIRKIVTIVEGLFQFPMMGCAVPEFELPHIRERIFGRYRIVYRIRESQIEILTVHHSSRLLTEV